ncbi:MAG: hypothetical protein E3J25_02910 [Anaerolineales bacterium]|nr:MAG: hypothetical protein E3J25_02910 [Anaerolineales bacterium]
MTLSTVAGCHKRSFRWLMVILLVCLLPLPLAKAEVDDPHALPSSPAGRQGVLRNPDFEEGFSEVDGGAVAEGWHSWPAEAGDGQESRSYSGQPGYEPEVRRQDGLGRVRSGSFAQKQSTTYAAHLGGIYQRVWVVPGSVVSFSIWVYVWSSSRDDPDRSQMPGNYRVSIGIDPKGGTQETAKDVVWSRSLMAYDRWAKLTVSTVARGEWVTVFTGGQGEWRVKHNDSYWDDASLQVVPPAGRALLSVEEGERSLRGTGGETDAWPTADGMVGVLQNPDFEEGFSMREAVEVTVAEEWEPWWVKGTEEEQARGYLRRPEYKPEERSARGGEGRVHSGNSGQKQFTTFATHTAGIYQRVPVVRGSTVSFSIWVYVWSSSKDDFDRSKGPGDYKVSVGLDPFGGTSGSASEVVWSRWVQQYDGWVKLRVQAVAQADQVTVFTRGQNGWRVRHNDSYWDDASLQVILPIGETARLAVGGSVPPIEQREDEPAPSGEATGDLSPSSGTPADGLPGGAGHLVFQNERLRLEWWRASDNLSLEITVPSRLEGELALWVDGNLVARWAILVVPSDALTVAWQADGELVGSIGLQVLDARGQLVGEYGLIGERAAEY